ncbi:hypothetical protein Dtox_1399 [Desulfofarcimen acetoxidans DSM 771]|uniref:Uncharacterized protein n=1 Tax=Desulfofarcimen acetoxidans (strain ATCC 49208 / DSM 771 / KCTC 5769 / VKM B-1644 / 5575) TaxID=485916 RepID=C8W6I6_DESAS|nr:hypothetical protein Dtox_1399 [Desulfofarcimen acetoxidans DSM 771]
MVFKILKNNESKNFLMNLSDKKYCHKGISSILILKFGGDAVGLQKQIDRSW